MGKINLEKAYLDSPELRQQISEGHERIKKINTTANKFSSLITNITQKIDEMSVQMIEFSQELGDLLGFEKDNFFTTEERGTLSRTLSMSSRSGKLAHSKSKHFSGSLNGSEVLLNTLSKLNGCIKSIQEQKVHIDKIKDEVITPLNSFNIQIEQLDYVKSQVEIQRQNYELQMDKFCQLSRKKEDRKSMNKEQIGKMSNAQNDYFCSLIGYINKVSMMNEKEGLYLLSKASLFITYLTQLSNQQLQYLSTTNQAISETYEKCYHIDQERHTQDLEMYMNLNLAKLPRFDIEETIHDYLILNEGGYKSGYLRLRPRGKKEWKRKYFYIQKPEGLLMSVEGSEAAIMVADIKTSMIQQADIDDRYNTFQIIDSPHSLISLQSETEKDLNDWMRTFRAIQMIDVDESELKTIRVSTEWSAELDEIMSQQNASPVAGPPSGVMRTPTLGRLYSKEDKLANSLLKETALLTMNVGCCELKTQKWKGKTVTIVASGYMKMCTPANEKKEEPMTIVKISDIPIELIIPVHPSLFDRKHVFCIKYGTKIFYLKCEDAEKYGKLTYWLKKFSIKPSPELIGSELIPVRYLRHVYIKLIDGRNFPNKGDFYCTVSMDNILLARTSFVENTPDLIIREDFKFEEFPSLSFGITISAYDTTPNRFTKDPRFGRVFIRAAKLKLEKEQEEYYQLIAGEEKEEEYSKLMNVGEIRIKWKYQEIRVLPMAKYRDLLQLMNSFDYELLKSLYKSAFDLEPLSHNLLMIYQAQNREIEWFMFLIEFETKNIDSNTLFRGNSILTKALEIYLKQTCFDYLDSCVGGFVKMLVENDISLEVDPTRIDKPEVLQHNWSQLIGFTETLWLKLFQTRKSIPLKLRVVLEFIRERATSRLKDQNIEYLSVSAFFFLRLICPALMAPKLFNLTRIHPSQNCQRTLTLIAKSIQSLANLSLLGVKEQYMHPMNAFIESKFPDMKQYLTDISTLDGPMRSATIYMNDEVHTYELENYLALFHQFVINYDNPLLHKDLSAICYTISNSVES